MTAPALDRAAWEIVTHPRGDYLRARTRETTLYADAHLREIEVSVHGPMTVEEARELSLRLVEAAAFAEGGPA